jgi:hypothetical protein
MESLHEKLNSICQPLNEKFAASYIEFAYGINKALEGGVEPLDAVLTKQAVIYAVEQSTEVEDIREFLRIIEDAVSHFKRICEKPRSHLKSANEVRPIDTVKRVGYESIPYLASHSEDWLAKTATGLKPARLFSRVEEDEYHIYENRVVKTLIDKIYSFLKASRDELMDKESQINSVINSQVQTSSFGFDVGFAKAVSKIFDMDSDVHGDKKRNISLDLAKQQRETATKLYKKFRDLKKSRLYRLLSKTKPVKSPLNQTNILLMDKDYSVAYKLWSKTERYAKQKTKVDVKPQNTQEQYTAYFQYCSVMVGFAAHHMGFERVADHASAYERGTDNLRLTIAQEDGYFTFQVRDASRRQWSVSGDYKLPDRTTEKFYRNGNTLFWDNDVTAEDIDAYCSLLKTRGSRSKEQSEERRYYTSLKTALDNENRTYGEVKISAVAVLPTMCEIDDASRNAFYDTAIATADKILKANQAISYAVIALPKIESNEKKLTNYGRESIDKIMFLPITAYDINSYRRIQLLLLRMIHELDMGRCPCCGNEQREDARGMICKKGECNLITTKTQCSHCKKKYAYIHYNNNYNTNYDLIERIKRIDKSDFFATDTAYQYKDIVNLTVRDDKIIPICPHCGK